MTKPDLIEEAITEAFGERCKEFAIGCPCCEAWREYDELRAKPDKNGWRPIETAPKDGRWVLLGDFKESDEGNFCIGVARFCDGAWEDEFQPDWYWRGAYTPSHWYPFAPKPPVTP